MTRDELFKHNLFDSYVADEYPQGICDASARNARTLDGSCNDLALPKMGSVGYRFGRNVALDKIPQHKSDEELMSPNPRTVAQKLLKRTEFTPASSVNLFVVAWIQFQVHDWMDHERAWGSPVEVPIPIDDPLAGKKEKLYLPRSVQDPAQKAASPGRPAAFKNKVSHWWDLSQIYGVTSEINNRIRTGVDGKLRLDTDGLLPLDTDGMDITGFKDNWWTGIMLLHTLFTREHNAICDMFKSKHADWSDQKLHDMARLVLTAQNAKIHTLDWTPGILQNKILKTAMQANWDGLLPDGLDNWKGGSVLTGIVGGNKDLHGVPFSLTEEFSAVYRLHSLMPDTLNVLSATTKKPTGKTYPLADITFRGARKPVTENTLADVMLTFGATVPGALTLNNYPTWLMNLTKPGEPFVIDLATTEIFRDRERGIPRYLAFRRALNMEPEFKTWKDINPSPAVQKQLASVYASPEDVDLLVGCMAEQPRPDGYGFSDTQFHVFILMAARRLWTDRFFTDDYRPEIYTKEGIEWVKTQGNFKSLVTRHFPELKSVMDSVDNPFKPWKV
ncbi:heme peroxidase [Fimicolochytrium jonesii]|uniref:heme peroxidase n=1 Tax=Fimicolochytrium jonesii TaxID=1396493 RepID=UPI0022FEEDDA|nr:heme peroxidase [Fimicolochytrium jonesii]KAI8824876.1 heme peroxidase [Fimicolochytrium jonesii]